MKLTQLDYFQAIAALKNMTRAAQELGVTEAALSQTLRQLETEAGVPLFLRTRSGLSITPEGRLYQEYVEKMLLLRDDLYRRLQSDAAGETLRIGIASQRGLTIFTDLITGRSGAFSGLHIEITEGRGNMLLQMLRRGRLDLVLTARCSVLNDGQLSSLLLREEPFVLVLPPDHPLSSCCAAFPLPPPRADLSVFRNENFVLNPADTCDGEIELSILRGSMEHPKVLCYVNNTDSILQMALHGIALTLLPITVASYKRDFFSKLCWCRPEHNKSRYLQLVFRKGHRFTELQKELFQVLMETYRSELKDAGLEKILETSSGNPS